MIVKASALVSELENRDETLELLPFMSHASLSKCR
jgi:hypothetical protein